MNKLKSKIFVLLVAACIIAVVAFAALLSCVNNGKIRRNVTVAGIDVSGLTKEQAKTKVTGVAAERVNNTVSLNAGDKRWIGRFADMGVRADVDGAVDSAYSIGRDGNFLQRAWAMAAAPKGKIPLRYLVDSKTFGVTLDKIAQTVEIPHIDAKLIRTEEGLLIDGDRIGVKLDKDASIKMFCDAVQSGNLSLNVKLTPDIPDVTSQMLSQVDTVLGSFTTRFPAWRKERTHNIRIAASKVDGTVIKPGEEFSYNKIVGLRTKELGFKDAPIFVKGKLVPGTGGGICQLSSTIYNAALLSNMKIVERSNHSSIVPYVSLGRDATVAYGLLDFRFRNTTSTPIYISSRMKGSYLYVDIYGSGRDKTDVAVVVEKINALRANVYRVVKRDGKEISRELVSRDKYRPAEPMVVTPKPKPQQRTVESAPVKRTQASYQVHRASL